MPKLAVLIHGLIDSKMLGRGEILHLSVICVHVLSTLDWLTFLQKQSWGLEVSTAHLPSSLFFLPLDLGPLPFLASVDVQHLLLPPYMHE